MLYTYKERIYIEKKTVTRGYGNISIFVLLALKASVGAWETETGDRRQTEDLITWSLLD